MKKCFVGLCWNEKYESYFHLKDYESGFDEFPVSKGHTLIITKRHAATFF